MESTRSRDGGGQAEVRLAPGAIVAERFEVSSFAGAGGMGTVYQARDRSTGALCALKVLRGAGGDQERFQREAEVLSAVVHPHVVGYVAHGTTAAGDPYLAMDWLEGDALKDLLAKRRLTPREAAHLGEAVASALSAAHANGVVHRDLKPSNLVVGGVRSAGIETVKVLDFGVARLRDLDRDLTRTGQVIGTPGYMAPEQARGEKDVDARADLFSLGCVLYRSIAGQPPFDGDDVLAVLTLLVLHDPPRVGDLVDGVPDELDELVARLLEKDRSRRPESAAVVSAELAAIAALPESAYERKARGVKSRRAAVVGGDDTATSLGRTVSELAGQPSASGSGARSVTGHTGAKRSLRLPVVAAAATLLVGGGIAVALLVTREDDAKKRDAAPSASLSVVEPGPTSTPPPRSIEELVKDLSQRCRAWGPILTRMRDASGAFGLEAQRLPGGWETGQAVMAWATAARACSFEGADRLKDSLGALEKLKRAPGWGSSDGRGPTEASSGATGWVLLGLVAANALSTDPELQRRAAEARALLLPLQNPTGTFLFGSASARGTEEDYSTMIAAWALVESDWLEPVVPAKDARRRAIGALRGYLTNRGGDPPVETVSGYEEQTAYVILRDRQKGGETPATDAPLFEKVAADLFARCASPSSAPGEIACVNGALSTNSHLEPDGGREYFKTFWLPWATLLASALSRDVTVGISSETRARLEGVARWTIAELGRANPATMTAVYQVAEHLLAASTLGLAEPTIELVLTPRPAGP